MNATPSRAPVPLDTFDLAPHFGQLKGWLWAWTKAQHHALAPILDMTAPDHMDMWWRLDTKAVHCLYICAARTPPGAHQGCRAVVGITRGVGSSFITPLRGACHAPYHLLAVGDALVSALGERAWQRQMVERGAPDPFDALWSLHRHLVAYELELP
jgi:hypothetical protein